MNKVIGSWKGAEFGLVNSTWHQQVLGTQKYWNYTMYRNTIYARLPKVLNVESTPWTGTPYVVVCQKYWKYTMYSVHHIRSSVMLSGNTSFCFFLTLSFPTQAMHFTPSLTSQMHKWFWFNWEKSNRAYKLRKPLCILRKNKLGQYYFCGEKNKMVCTRAEKSDFWKSI